MAGKKTYIFSVVMIAAMAFILGGCGVLNNQKPWPNGYPYTVARDAKLEIIYKDTGNFFEGPSWDSRSGKIIFTGWKDKQLLRLTKPNQVEILVDKTPGINGTFMRPDGKLLAAEVRAHRVSCYDLSTSEAKLEILAENPNWNQPNDLCQSFSGNIYFTDPDFRKKTNSSVYMLDTMGKVHKIIDDMTLPNGIMVSLESKTLYVADSVEKHWKSYKLNSSGTVITGSGKIFFAPQTQSTADPDGMTIDKCGNLYLTGLGGLWCVSPAGEKLGFIEIPQFCSNVTFGGPDGKTLYITCRDVVYKLKMNLCGGYGVK